MTLPAGAGPGDRTPRRWGERERRPLRSFRTGPVVRVVHALVWVAVAAVTVTVAASYPGLPDRIPTHFDAAGRPDGWGSKATVWALLAIWVAGQAAITALARVPHVHSYPVEVTAENAQALYRESERLLVAVSATTAVLLGTVVLATTGVGEVGWLLGLGSGATVLVCVVGVVRMSRVGRR